MPAVTIYVDKSGGKWEARWWSHDEGRYFRFQDYDQQTAENKCIRATGYTRRDCKFVYC